jgi:hypothetical protein
VRVRLVGEREADGVVGRFDRAGKRDSGDGQPYGQDEGYAAGRDG